MTLVKITESMAESMLTYMANDGISYSNSNRTRIGAYGGSFPTESYFENTHTGFYLGAYPPNSLIIWQDFVQGNYNPLIEDITNNIITFNSNITGQSPINPGTVSWIGFETFNGGFVIEKVFAASVGLQGTEADIIIDNTSIITGQTYYMSQIKLKFPLIYSY